MASPRYRHIIWDWNGTLLDDLDLCIEIMNGLLAPRGLAVLDRARHHALFDFPVRDYYRRLGFDTQRDPFERLSVDFIDVYDRRRWECRLHAEAEAMLRAARTAGISQSILSAYRQETLQEIVRHLGLADYFIRMIGLDNIYAHSKVELGRAWLQELGLPRDQVVLVGDTRHDHEVAQALEVDCVLVTWGHHSLEKLQTPGTRVVPNFSALATELGLAVTA
ncbi:HAD family hydrolase [Opitutus terrae]|uniref:phosphoglycolate phosphatase n=1 Tax=Opitutus terrae (strain DSM 11246 / JCM 15787 / PB90-1) TaxID=452637 RepID=B1ZVD9_OPITP|nr:HAD family hydrolase [Opitutus terrae]ACB76806.1 Haloacid dehalogenase domain protein hydrolase [Opitutus terrae PB90-1]